jgi:hypothetical protein
MYVGSYPVDNGGPWPHPVRLQYLQVAFYMALRLAEFMNLHGLQYTPALVRTKACLQYSSTSTQSSSTNLSRRRK